MNAHRAWSDSDFATKVRRWVQGELTWAEVEGVSSEEAMGAAKLGCELAEAGMLEESKVLFEGLLALNPKDAAAHAALGTVLQKLGRSDDAILEYTAALELAPGHAVALANRGECRLRRGDQGGFLDLVQAAAVDAEGKTAAGRRAKDLIRAMALNAAGKSSPDRIK